MTDAEFLDSLDSESTRQRLAELDRMPVDEVCALHEPERNSATPLGQWLSQFSLAQIWHWRNEHEWAMGIVFGKMKPRLQGFARAAGAHSPEEAVQETFYRALKAAARPESLEGYLLRILRNIVFDGFRRAGARETSLEAIQQSGRQFAGLSKSQLESLENGETSERLRRCLEKLNPGEKRVIELRYFERLGYAEIALRQGTSEGAEFARWDRAKKKLQQCMGKHFQGGPR